jgi:ribonuclease P protein component
MPLIVGQRSRCRSSSASGVLALPLTTAVAQIKIPAMQKRLRFPKSRRLTLDSEFQRVRTEGASIRGGTLTLGVLKDAEAKAPVRAGFITSRRVGGAVVRNRTRRRLREIFRKHQHEICGGVFVVTIASAQAARETYHALEDEWLRLARRASILAP